MEEGNIVEHKNYLFVEEEKRKRAHAVRATISGPLLRWISRRETVSIPVEMQCPPDGGNSPSISTSGGPRAKSAAPQPGDNADAPQLASSSEFRTELASKNYVIHEASQDDAAARPPWKDTMTAMFGDHVKWEDLKAYVSRGRPLSRPVQICSITGQPARYVDPRTRVPYATPTAYRTLSMILNHEYVWSNALGCYLTRPELSILSTMPGGTAKDGEPSAK